MTPVALASYIRYKTKTNSTTFTDSDILALLNVTKDDMSAAIAKQDASYFQVPAYHDLVANQREYPLDDTLLNSIFAVEISFDGTTWIRMRRDLDLRQYTRTTDETTIVSLFANSEGRCYYDIIRKSLFIYTGTISNNVTNGIKVWYHTYPADITSLSSTVDMAIDPNGVTAGFPRQFHELLGRAVIIDYKESRIVPIPLSQSEQRFDADYQGALDAIMPIDTGGDITGKLPSAHHRGNEGFDL